MDRRLGCYHLGSNRTLYGICDLVFSDRINAAVLDLHDSVPMAPFATFREACLRRVRALIPFDAAIWGSGVEEPQLIFGIAACDFPPDRLMDYGLRWQSHDVLRSAVSRRPGECLRNEDIQSLDAHYASEIYREFCGPAGIEHALGVTRIDPVMYEGKEIIPLQFLKAVLPEPASLGATTKGIRRATPARETISCVNEGRSST